MKLKTLQHIPAWEWPDDAGKTFLEILRNHQADGPDRLVAAELAGDYTVISDELAEALLTIVSDAGEPDRLRARAAISFGAALEAADEFGFEKDDDPAGLGDDLDSPISEEMFGRIQETLERLYADPAGPKGIRRKALEASVRAPRDWHRQAVAAAYESGDQDWKLTAVFCMNYIGGFEKQVLESINSPNPLIRCEAVAAAGRWELDAAWPRVLELLQSNQTDKNLLLTAIEASASIRPEEAGMFLVDLSDSDDEDIAEAALEAMIMAENASDEDDEDY